MSSRIWRALAEERSVASHLRIRRWVHAGREWLTGPSAVHSAVEVCWLEHGTLRYRVGLRSQDVRAGQVMLVPPGVEHITEIAGDTHARSVWLGADAVAELCDALGTPKRFPRLEPGLVVNAPEVTKVLQLLTSEAFSPVRESGSDLALDALGEVLTLCVLRAAGPRPGPAVLEPRIRAVLELIETRYAEPLSLDALAKTAGMSRFHFARRFREQVGRSPYEYLLEWRLLRAAELLARGHASVTVAALSVGFGDLGRFARRFRARFGCSPSSYAETRRTRRASPRQP